MSRFTELAVQLTAALSIIGTGYAASPGPWVAFRYNVSEVLFYSGKMRDPAGFTADELEHTRLPQPAAQWGGGGYLITLTVDRLGTLEHVNSTGELPSVHVGDKVTVRLNRSHAVSAIVDRLLEQWGGENPIVQIGVLVRVPADQLAEFHSVASDYFLAYYGLNPNEPTVAVPNPVIGPRRVLNDFGALGKLVLVRGDDGWNVGLWRDISGELRPTSVIYAYGD